MDQTRSMLEIQQEETWFGWDMGRGQTGKWGKHDVLGGGFKYVLFSPLVGEMIQFDQ